MLKEKDTMKTVSSDILNSLNGYALFKKIDTKRIYAESGFDFDTIRKNNMRISFNNFSPVWDTVAAQSCDPDFGLHFAQYINNHNKGSILLYSILSNCSSIEHSITNLIQYHDIAFDLLKFDLKINTNKAVLSWNADYFPIIEQDRNYSESIMARLALLLIDLSDNSIRLSEINFIHQKPVSTDEHSRLFKCPVNFGTKRNQLVFDSRYLSVPILFSNSDLLNILEQYATKILRKLNLTASFAEQTTHAINAMLSTGVKPSIENVADKLDLSVRILQNRLKEENTSYQIILETLRKEISINIIINPEVRLSEIAFLLGFTEQSSFNHAFRKWTGLTPKEYQRQYS